MTQHKTDSGHTIGKEFPEQEEITKYTTSLIQKINGSGLEAIEKAEMIKNLKGITRAQMECILNVTGPTLDESIRKYIEESNKKD